MSKITLKNMKFHAFHGVLEDEKINGNDFLVTVSVKLDTSKAGFSDKLEDTLNYQAIYDLVKMEMETPSELIEHVAQRIYAKIQKSFPQVKKTKLKLTKLNPPLGGEVEGVSIEL